MLNETLLPFGKPAAYWPVRPVPAMSALHRWRLTGIKGVNGQMVKLETVKIGGRRFTSKEAVLRFIWNQNEPAAPQTTTKRRASSEDVLRAMGVLSPSS